MKKVSFLLAILFCALMVKAQRWSDYQLEAANTAADISYLTYEEKEAIKYINLARMYPSQFAENEVRNYRMPNGYVEVSRSYLNSLITDLNRMNPVGALNFDANMYQYAKCFAKESGINGIVGHQRSSCSKGNFAENCSYGMQTGRDIAMQWLIDDGIESLGHRINCLNGSYTKIGLSIHPHTIYNVCAVADMIW